EEYGSHIIKFENQSYAQIAIAIFDNQFGSVSQLTSNLSDKIFEILDENHISPFIATVSADQEQGDYGHGFDITKSYASGILNNETDFAIFQPFDEVKPFTKNCEMVAGEYYISCDIKINKDMKLSKGYYPLVFVNELLSRKVIKKSNITLYIPAKLFIKADVFKSFVEHIYTKYESDDAKKMINFFIGSLGTKYSKIDTGCITTEFEIACALQIQYSADHNISIDKYEDLFFVRAQTKTKKNNTALPIHRHIICLGIINMINLYDAVTTPESKVIAFNTDSIMVKYPNENIQNLVQPEDSIIESLGKIRSEDWKIKSNIITEVLSRELVVYKPVEWILTKEGDNFLDFCQIVSDSTSAVIIGSAGCGKTEVIKNLLSRCRKSLVLAFTNKAIENIITRSGSDNNIYTFDSFLNDHLDDFKKDEKLAQYDEIIIEEYSMAPVRFLNILNNFKAKNPSTKFLFFGDSNQCLQVDSNKIIYDYIQTSTFNKMCNGNLFECSYKEQYSRYDMPLKVELDYFLRNDKIQESLKDKSEIESFNNICRSAEKKWKINHDCSVRFRKENPLSKSIKVELTKDIKSKSTKFQYTFIEGQELMCIDKIITKNTDGTLNKLINGTICKLTSIESDKIVVNDLKMDVSTFISKFEPNFCQSVYKYQGASIDKPFNIHELHYLTKRELYTAMS
ncbi:MAG: AAA family ATPase, partial [Pseudomonadota bacterium]